MKIWAFGAIVGALIIAMLALWIYDPRCTARSGLGPLIGGVVKIRGC